MKDDAVSTSSMELFLQACGWSGPLRLGVECLDPPSVRECVLEQPFALVGSDARMDLRLDHPHLGRRQAYLQLLGGKLFWIHLHQRFAGTLPHGAKRSGWLEAEELLPLGAFGLRLRSSDEAFDAVPFAAPPALPADDLPEVALEFVNRIPGPTVWRMGTALALVGRAPLCRVRLVGSSVSRFHCSLVRTPLGLWVVDLFGKGGITVNEVPVRSARLEDGDRLQVGHFIIRPRYRQPMPSRLPFRHLTEATEPFETKPSSNFALPVFSETPAAAPPPAREYESATGPVSSLSTVAAPETPPPPPFPLLPPWLPAPAEATPAHAEMVQALLVPVAQQLGVMQQQMFEQFQQAMMMMFQMFGKLQREQLGVLRDEMDRLHELSREVLALQTQLARQSQATAAKPRPAPAPPQPRSVPTHPPTPVGPRPAGPAKGEENAKPLPPSPVQPEKDMHAWLSQRLAALQKERQTRWQRIMSFLTGKANESPSA